MAIAENPDSSFDHIRDSGFETALDQLIAYADMQARLHQSLVDRVNGYSGFGPGLIYKGPQTRSAFQ